jgi:hypothetical protein
MAALGTAQGAWDFTRLALAVGIRETGSIAGDIEMRDQILNMQARAALGLDARRGGDEDEEPATSYQEAGARLFGTKRKSA